MHLLGKSDASSSTFQQCAFTSPVRIHHRFQRSQYLAPDSPLSASHADLICLRDETVIHYVITRGNSDPIMSAAARNAGDWRRNSGSVSSCGDWQRILAETDGSIFLRFIGSWLWLWGYWSCMPSEHQGCCRTLWSYAATTRRTLARLSGFNLQS